DFARTEAARDERREDGAGADAAMDVDVAEGRVGQEIRERAKSAELVEETLDAAAREAERDLAPVATRERVGHALDHLRIGRVAVGVGAGAGDAKPAGCGREPRGTVVRIDGQPGVHGTCGPGDV